MKSFKGCSFFHVLTIMLLQNFKDINVTSLSFCQMFLKISLSTCGMFLYKPKSLSSIIGYVYFFSTTTNTTYILYVHTTIHLE